MYHFIHKHFRIRLKKHKIIIASKKFNNSFKIAHHFQNLNCFKNDIYEKKLKIWTLTWELKLLRNDSHFVFDVTSYYGYYYFQLFFKSFIIYNIQIYSEMCDITILKYLWMRWYNVWDRHWNNNTSVVVSGRGLDEMRLAMTWLLLKLRNRHMGVY